MFPKNQQNRVRRIPERGHYDRATIYPIVDEALICHVGFSTDDNQPFVIPTIHAREEDTIYLHGAKASRLLKHIQAGNPVCITVTLLDGIVFARSVFNSSMNYRSAVLFGRGRLLTDDADKMHALVVISDHLARGRWEDSRKPTQKELDATSVVAVEIENASAKVRSGPPGDDEEDYALPIWAGVLPLRQEAGVIINDPRLEAEISVPDYLVNYQRGS